jgi:hypothetical protein
MLGFSALSQAPLGSVVAEAEAPLVYIGAIGAGQLGAYAIGASTSVAGEAPTAIDGTANASGVTVGVGEPVSTAVGETIANAAGVTVAIQDPVSTAVGVTSASATSNTVNLTAPSANATAAGNAVASAESNTVTVNSPVAQVVASSLGNASGVTVSVSTAQSTISVGNTAFAGGITVTLSAPVASLAANAEAPPESPVITISVPVVSASGKANISVADLQTVQTSAPAATGNVSVTASAQSNAVSVTHAEASVTGDAAINYAELIDVGIVPAEPTLSTSNTVDVTDLSSYPISVVSPTALVNLGGFVIAEASPPIQQVTPPVISVSYGDMIGEPRVGAVHQTTYINSYGNEVTVQLPLTVQNGGTLWSNGNQYWLNWDKKRVFILSTVGTSSINTTDGGTRNTYPLHVLQINENGTTTLLNTYPSTSNTPITSNSSLTSFVLFSDTFRDGWAFFYKDQVGVTSGTSFFTASVDYSQEEGFRFNGTGIKRFYEGGYGLGDVFGSATVGSGYLFAAGSTGANWFLQRIIRPVGYTNRYVITKVFKGVSNTILWQGTTNSASLTQWNALLATYDASTIIALADQISHKYLNAYEAGSDTGRFQSVEQFDELRIQVMPEITVTPAAPAFPISVDVEVSTVFVTPPSQINISNTANPLGVTINLSTPDVLVVVQTVASSGIPALLVTVPETTFGSDYEANINLPSISVTTPTVYPSIVDFPDLPTIGVIKPNVQAFGTAVSSIEGFEIQVSSPEVSVVSNVLAQPEVSTVFVSAPVFEAFGVTNVEGFEVSVANPDADSNGTANANPSAPQITVVVPEVVAVVSYVAYAEGVTITRDLPTTVATGRAIVQNDLPSIIVTPLLGRALVNIYSLERTVSVPAENRSISVDSDIDRAIIVPFDDRTIEVTR